MSAHSISGGFRSGGPAPTTYDSSRSMKPASSTVCAASDGSENPLESHARRRSRSGNLKPRRNEKQAPFVVRITIGKAVSWYSPVGKPEDQDRGTSESDVDDHDTSGWEDCESNSGSPSANEQETIFRRIESQISLTSRCSMLTTLIHDSYTEAMASEAISTVRASKQSHDTTHGEAYLTSSLVPEMQFQTPFSEASRSKVTDMIISNTTLDQELVLSPRTARRNMLCTELTESLRVNLLSERKRRSTGYLTALKKKHNSTNEIFRRSAEPNPVFYRKDGAVTIFHNDFFDAGLQDYHERGW